MAKREQRPAARTPRKTTGTRRKPTSKAAAPTTDAANPGEAALAAFESAMRTLQGHDYAAAAHQFTDLIDRFPDQTALLDRARVYLELCRRELSQQPDPPTTPEERLTLATAALNNDDEDEAERLAREVLAEDPRNDLALYLTAAVHARRGDSDTALDALRKAFEVSPDVGAQARHDADFDALRTSPEFQALVETSESDDAAKAQVSRLPRR